MGCTTMPDKMYEYYNTGDDYDFLAYWNSPLVQTFTVGTVGDNENFMLTDVKVKLYNNESAFFDHDICFHILPVDEYGIPPDPYPEQSICKKCFIDRYFSQGTHWYTIPFKEFGVVLQSGTTYGLMVRGTSLNPRWFADKDDGAYSGGTFYYYSIWPSWTATNHTAMFEIWGRKQIDDKVTIKSSSESAYRLVSSSEEIYNISAENEEVYDISSEHEQIYNINDNN